MKELKSDPIIHLQTEICKAIANQSRLLIVRNLCDGEKSPSELMEATDVSKANLSQHMNILKSSGIVKVRKEGVNVFYSLADSRISDACHIMRSVVVGVLEENKKLLHSEQGLEREKETINETV